MNTAYLFALMLNTNNGCTFYLKDINRGDNGDDYRLELSRSIDTAGMFPFSSVNAPAIKDIFVDKAFICNDDLSDLIADGKIKPKDKYFEFTANNCKFTIKTRRVNISIVPKEDISLTNRVRLTNSKTGKPVYMVLKSKYNDNTAYLSLYHRIKKEDMPSFSDIERIKILCNDIDLPSFMTNQDNLNIVRIMKRKDFNEYIANANDIAGIRIISANNDNVFVCGHKDDYSLDANKQMKSNYEIEYVQMDEPIGDLFNLGEIF